MWSLGAQQENVKWGGFFKTDSIYDLQKTSTRRIIQHDHSKLIVAKANDACFFLLSLNVFMYINPLYSSVY